MWKGAFAVVFLASLVSNACVEAFQVGHALPGFALQARQSAPALQRTQKPPSVSIHMVSGIDTLPLALQSATFLGTISGVTAGGLVLAGPVLDGVRDVVGSKTFKLLSAGSVLLGLFFFAAGISHFTLAEAFKSIYPPPGTWGLWWLPGSADFHVAWSGVAEILGGLGLAVGSLSEIAPQGLRANLRKLRKFAGASLFLLTVCVSPANIYMWSHNINMVGVSPPGDLPVTFHYIRAGFQVLLLGLFARIAQKTDNTAAE